MDPRRMLFSNGRSHINFDYSIYPSTPRFNWTTIGDDEMRRGVISMSITGNDGRSYAYLTPLFFHAFPNLKHLFLNNINVDIPQDIQNSDVRLDTLVLKNVPIVRDEQHPFLYASDLQTVNLELINTKAPPTLPQSSSFCNLRISSCNLQNKDVIDILKSLKQCYSKRLSLQLDETPEINRELMVIDWHNSLTLKKLIIENPVRLETTMNVLLFVSLLSPSVKSISCTGLTTNSLIQAFLKINRDADDIVGIFMKKEAERFARVAFGEVDSTSIVLRKSVHREYVTISKFFLLSSIRTGSSVYNPTDVTTFVHNLFEKITLNPNEIAHVFHLIDTSSTKKWAEIYSDYLTYYFGNEFKPRGNFFHF